MLADLGNAGLLWIGRRWLHHRNQRNLLPEGVVGRICGIDEQALDDTPDHP